MKKSSGAALWGTLAAAALILHFWPMAYWSSGTLLFFRGAAGFCAQMFFLKAFPNRAISALPLVVTGLLAGWGIGMSFSSQVWAVGFPWDYCISFLTCLAAWPAWLIRKK